MVTVTVYADDGTALKAQRRIRSRFHRISGIRSAAGVILQQNAEMQQQPLRMMTETVTTIDGSTESKEIRRAVDLLRSKSFEYEG